MVEEQLLTGPYYLGKAVEAYAKELAEAALEDQELRDRIKKDIAIVEKAWQDIENGEEPHEG